MAETTMKPRAAKSHRPPGKPVVGVDPDVKAQGRQIAKAGRAINQLKPEEKRRSVAIGDLTVQASGRRVSPSSKPGTRPMLNFARISMTPKIELVEMIRGGVPANDFKEIVKRMGLAQDRVGKFIGVPMATVNKKSLENANLSPDASARVIGLASLIGQVETMVTRSGNPEGFDAAKWVARWIEQPSPALDGRKPADLMDTAPGQEIVANLVAMMESGAYA